MVPDCNVMSAFQERLAVVFSKLKNAEFQAQTLSTLRDTLLPRLISGQLRVAEAQTTVEKAFA